MKNFILLTCFVFSIAIAQAQNAKVSGIVTENASSQVVSGAKVELKSKTNGSFVKRALSESNGKFEFTEVPYGDYRFTVTLMTFDTIVKDVKINKPNQTDACANK